MSVPTHHLDCITKAYRTKCPDCQEAVFHFACSCGSRVFFDDLGDPWPQHFCKSREIRERLEMLQEIERYSTEEIYKLITDHEKKYDTEVSDTIPEMIEFVIGQRKYPFKITEMEVDENIKMVQGKIMARDKRVNLYKKFGYDMASPMASALMGKLAQQEYGEICVRERPDKRNTAKQYRILIPSESAIRQGDTIIGLLSVERHAKGKAWVMKEVERI